MNYPLISEYIEAIRSAEDNFATFTNLRPIMDEEGNPIMTSGNFAVVFKMKDTTNGNLYAVKCFLKDQPNRAESYRMIAEELEYVSSAFLVQFRYLDKELFVDTSNSDEQEFPVLVMDWVDGVTLDKYIRQNIDDQYVLRMLAYQFSKLAMWIIPQPFAHGDIKPDNVMVREDGSLVLIDYDGMYVPAMKGQKARELGSPDFRHPSRTENDFDEHIDDFSLVSILLSLHAIANDSSLLDKYGAADRLLFSENNYRNISSCQLIKELYPSTDIETNTLVSLFTLTLIKEDLSKISYNLLSLRRPERQSYSHICTSITNEDLDAYMCVKGNADEYGGTYNSDWTRFLELCNDKVISYQIRKHTKAICDFAFSKCNALRSVIIPQSICAIGINPFANSNIEEILCQSKDFYVDSKTLYDYHRRIISYWGKQTHITLSKQILEILDSSFEGCKYLKNIFIPNNVARIGSSAFARCTSLESIMLPVNISELSDYLFDECYALLSVDIPPSVESIGEGAFNLCESLQTIIIPKSVKTIGDVAFSLCRKLQTVYILNFATSISSDAFDHCDSLRTIFIPKGSLEHYKKQLPSCTKKLVEK